LADSSASSGSAARSTSISAGEGTSQERERCFWNTGFRQSRACRRFFDAVGRFVHDIEEMRHYQVTLSSNDRSSA
jgi:hypothetical protein